MKRIVSIILTLMFALGIFGITASADGTSKIHEELQEVIARSNPEDMLKVTVWFTYPECPEPDFTVENYGESLDDVHRYMHDYREYKKNYYTEQNKLAIDEITDAMDAEVTWISHLVPSADITLRVQDIAQLEELSIIGKILVNYDDVPIVPAQDTPYLYEDIYREMLTGSLKEENIYRELYYHMDENNEIDWALAAGESIIQATMMTGMVAADRVIIHSTGAENFKFGYGIYDVAMGQFVDLYDIRDDLSLYPGLSDVLWDLKIGKPVGDADNDGDLTIFDVTLIQRYLAELASEDEISEVYWLADENDREMRYADADRDGGVTIFDATRIQRSLAGFNS